MNVDCDLIGLLAAVVNLALGCCLVLNSRNRHKRTKNMYRELQKESRDYWQGLISEKNKWT